MHAQGAGGAAEVAPVGLQGGDDELPFELPSGLLQGQAAANELIDDLEQASVEILVGQNGVLEGQKYSLAHLPSP